MGNENTFVINLKVIYIYIGLEEYSSKINMNTLFSSNFDFTT